MRTGILHEELAVKGSAFDKVNRGFIGLRSVKPSAIDLFHRKAAERKFSPIQAFACLRENQKKHDKLLSTVQRL